MGGRKESEEYRLQMLRRLEQENAKPDPPEVSEAKKVIAKNRQKKLDRSQQIKRLRTPLPEPDLCPKCYYLHGVTVELKPRESQTDKDLFRCPRCHYQQVRDPWD